MWRRWQMRQRKSSRTSTLLRTSGHTKMHFNEKLKVRLAHFCLSVTPTATAGHDVISVPCCPAARARVPYGLNSSKRTFYIPEVS